jgi:hypothetical protein
MKCFFYRVTHWGKDMRSTFAEDGVKFVPCLLTATSVDDENDSDTRGLEIRCVATITFHSSKRKLTIKKIKKTESEDRKTELDSL